MQDRCNGRSALRWRTLAWLVATAVVIAGCQKVGQGTAEASVGHGDGQRLSAASDDAPGNAADDGMSVDAIASLPLPDAFPNDVYRPSRYTVNTVFDIGGTAMVSMTAPGRVTALFADARKAMQAQGWTQTMAAQHSVDNAVLAFEKERRSATLSFNKAQDSAVLVNVQLQEDQ